MLASTERVETIISLSFYGYYFARIYVDAGYDC